MIKGIKRWVQDNPEKVAYGIAALGAYGIFKLLGKLYKSAAQSAQANPNTSMGEFIEMGDLR